MASTNYVDNKVTGLATETYVQEQVAGISVTNELDARLLIGRGAGSLYTGAGSGTNLNSDCAFGARTLVVGSSSNIPPQGISWSSTIATSWKLLNEQDWFNSPFTVNIGANALTVGKDTVTLDYNSAAIGMKTIAGSRNSIALGEGTVAYRRGQVVVGRFNTYVTPAANVPSGINPAFIVGIGTNNDNRINGFEVRMNGDAMVHGNLIIGGTPTETNHVITKGYVDNNFLKAADGDDGYNRVPLITENGLEYYRLDPDNIDPYKVIARMDSGDILLPDQDETMIVEDLSLAVSGKAVKLYVDAQVTVLSNRIKTLEEENASLSAALTEILALQDFYTGETFNELHEYAMNVAEGGTK